MSSWVAPDDFAEFVRGRHVELLRFAYLLSGDRHLAEDLVQDALERTGMAWKRVQRQDDPEGYVRRTITNRYLNRLRSLRREHLVGDLPERGYIDREPPDRGLWRLLAQLPRQQRAVLVLRFYFGLFRGADRPGAGLLHGHRQKHRLACLGQTAPAVAGLA